jgi:long-subunit fatty acid transport protein
MIRRLTKIGYVLALTGIGLAAADDGTQFSAKVGLISPQGDLHTLTRGSFGYGGELGYDLTPTKAMGVGLGFNAGFLVARGKNTNVETFDAKATYAGLDLIYPIGEIPLTLRAGLQLITWDVTSITADPGLGAMGDTSWKLGFRFGVEYQINKKWSVSSMYNISHWKADVTPNSGGNPSFVTLMAGYKF